MGHDVFVSHSSLDKLAADAVCHGLEARGIRCWIAPRDQVAGQPYGEQIAAAIEASQVMVLVFSDNVNKSQAVHNEVGLAAGANIAIVPFRLAQVEFNSELHFYLGRMHWLDAFPQSVDHYIEPLIATVQRNITRVSGAATGAVATDAVSTPAPPVPAPEALSPPPPPAPPPVAAAIAQPPRKTNYRPLAIIAGLAATAALAALAWVLLQHPAATPPISVKDAGNEAVAVGGAGNTALPTDSNAALAPPAPGGAPDPSAVHYYETVIAPDGPPADIQGATLITTDKLVQSLKDRGPGTKDIDLIDAGGCNGGPSLPGAICLKPNTIKELQAAIPNKQAQLVIFSQDGRYVLSYALAMEAVSAGYGNIVWYRGGINAWTANGGQTEPLHALPTVDVNRPEPLHVVGMAPIEPKRPQVAPARIGPRQPPAAREGLRVPPRLRNREGLR